MYPGETKTIKLYTPVTITGDVVLTEVSMREPVVRDRILFAKDRGTEEEKEARMIASLCGISEQDLYKLTAADYIQMEEAFNVFMLPPAKRPKAISSESSEPSGGD
ncbi:phage tail assembly protein [Erwinia endophytica]|uniref:phage tail assembly protein n=1 Tax=Erwinia endophytica TaxID=1563158 RepID=UPI001265EE8A|nr:phage tail assembly protein [Erwinia endophytica]KAB8307263.1 phage tail assembly protein [Erwinia endophytica]